jgi:hypothetical protein
MNAHRLIVTVFTACMLLQFIGKDAVGQHPNSVVSLDGSPWQLATDPRNVGREEKWFDAPRGDAKPTKVPSILQETLPGYHGVVWYWRDFTPPVNPHPQGRYLLRFWQVDYLADVWLNGVHVGKHEGGEDPFVLDVTDALRPNAANRVAVRVLNPTFEPIDGIKLEETPRRNKMYPIRPGSDYNYGGITDSVELLVAPAVRVEDLFVRPDPKTGIIRIQTNLRNAGKQGLQARSSFTVSPATSGETLAAVAVDRRLPPGDTRIETELKVENPRPWQLEDPYLYRVTVRAGAGDSFDECSTRCGFRDFRMQDGYFRLNGKRIFLKSSHSGADTPIGIRVPTEPEMLRKDLLHCKIMGFNMIRFIAGMPQRFQLDMCDEIGLMVYEENFAGWCLGDSPKLEERFNHSTLGMVRRDRNHPSIVMWGMLNEMPIGPTLYRGIAALPLVRALDDTRVVMLNSGTFDNPPSATGPGPSMWHNGWAMEPNVARNLLDKSFLYQGTTWPPKQLALHPGVGGEYSVVRWTAPADGSYAIAATFRNIVTDGVATTDIHILHQGKPIFESFINLNGHGPEEKFAHALAIKKGECIDTVVGVGGDKPTGDTTGLDMTIKSSTGQVFNVSTEFDTKVNPNGPWTYGWLAPGKDIRLDTFRPYTVGETESRITRAGRICNPGSNTWEDILSDLHLYPPVPQTAAVIDQLRTLHGEGHPLWLSEYGVGSAIDLSRLARQYEQRGKTACEDAIAYRGLLDQFTADWKKWNLDDTFAGPEDYFHQCLAWMANERKLGINALRTNPLMIGCSMTGTHDQGYSGEGLTATTFRELKPGVVDAMCDAFSPLRWCLFAEPMQIYRGRKARLEAVLANEDVLAPGDYPVRLQVVGPRNVRVFDRTITVKIPDPKTRPEPGFAMPVFAEDVVIDGPSGKYRFLAAFQKGAAATGGDIAFHVADPAKMPAVSTDVVLWGDDTDLGKWLKEHGIKTRTFAPGLQSSREVILVGNRPLESTAEAFRELARHIARGSHVVFLCPEVFKKGDDAVGWLPLVRKGSLATLKSTLYHKDEWAKRHPIFEGLPAGCILDHMFYRNVIPGGAWDTPNAGWSGQDVPAEIVSGAIDTSLGYGSGLTMGVWNLSAGRLTLNTFRIRDNLGSDPVAERLLRNMLNHAARDSAKPPADLPADFDNQLKAMHYE